MSASAPTDRDETHRPEPARLSSWDKDQQRHGPADHRRSDRPARTAGKYQPHEAHRVAPSQSSGHSVAADWAGSSPVLRHSPDGSSQFGLNPVPVGRERAHARLEHNGGSAGVRPANVQMHGMALDIDRQARRWEPSPITGRSAPAAQRPPRPALPPQRARPCPSGRCPTSCAAPHPGTLSPPFRTFSGDRSGACANSTHRARRTTRLQDHHLSVGTRCAASGR